jgi:hypothetical protein
MEQIEKMQDPDLDVHIGYLKQNSVEVPTPTIPVVPRGHHDYDFHFDWKRISYLRNEQHVQISRWVAAVEALLTEPLIFLVCLQSPD